MITRITVVMLFVLFVGDVSAENSDCLEVAESRIPIGLSISLTLADSSRVEGIVDAFSAELQRISITSSWSSGSSEYSYSEITEIRYSVSRGNSRAMLGVGILAGVFAGIADGMTNSQQDRSITTDSTTPVRVLKYAAFGGVLGLLAGVVSSQAFPKTKTIRCGDDVL